MTKEQAYNLFEKMIGFAKKEIVDFTVKNKFDVEKKADKTVVTACDRHIDRILTGYARAQSLSVISEEGEKENEIVKSGNYITIDPIDGTLGYIEHVNYALDRGDINAFLRTDLGPQSDFGLLLGIVEDSRPKYGCSYHYVTGEKILLDASDKNNCRVELEYRTRKYENACYIDPRPGEEIQKRIMEEPDVKGILQATLGLKSLYTILNQHDNAVTIHRAQIAGLWDILPAAVASKAYGGILLDGKGEEVVYNKYIILPGKDATIIKGQRFISVQDELKKKPYLN